MWEYNLPKRFEKIVKSFAYKTALIINEEKFTFHDLDSTSNQVAKYLLASNLTIGDVISISGKKCFESYALIVACWKIGVAYFFVDSDSPIKRINLMINRCKPKIIFAEKKVISKIEDLRIKNVQLDELFSEAQKNKSELESKFETIPGDTIAYIMFTSGSTGDPNGVAVAHSSILHFINWAKNEYELDSEDIFAGLNPLYFDNSVFDTYASLLNGSCLTPLSKSLVQDPNKAIKLLEKYKITIWFSVPSLLVYYLRFKSIKKDSLVNLRYFIFGGEGFPKSKLFELYKLLGHRVILSNVYGPTEITCICSSYKISEIDFSEPEMANLSPLGEIIPNFGFLILDDENKSVLPGEIGQLALSGPHLSRGYYNNKIKTNERFIRNPNNNKLIENIYLTGDLVKLNVKNNLIYFCGRKDSQIKFMGYRIELGEIEACLNRHPMIYESCVTFGVLHGIKQITCFVSTKLNKKELREILLNDLPDYMIPRDIVIMEQLPKNQNSKIDRLKLSRDYYDQK